MKFITNLLQNKKIFLYLAFILLSIFIIYNLFKYKEAYRRPRRRQCRHFNYKNCMKRAHQCIWYRNSQQCIHKNLCKLGSNRCNNNFYCNWNKLNNVCEFKPIIKNKK